MLRRRFYVKTPFGNLSDFSPFHVPPPEGFTTGVAIGDHFVREGHSFGCVRPDELRQRLESANGRILIFRGQHRSCAAEWAPMLSTLWRALGGAEATFADMDRRSALLYGCVLRLLFKPGEGVRTVLNTRANSSAGALRTVGVHMRFGDYYRLRPTGGCPSVKTPEQAARIEAFLDGLSELPRIAFSSPSPSVAYRVEADDVCVQRAISQGLKARGLHVAPAVASDVGTTLGVASLAAWFAFAASDAFALLPLCERWGTRLSGWSAMALLHAQQQTFHRICDVYARRPLCATARAINCSTVPRNFLSARPHNGSERQAEVQSGRQALVWTVANFA